MLNFSLFQSVRCVKHSKVSTVVIVIEKHLAFLNCPIKRLEDKMY